MVVEDARGDRYHLKFDYPAQPETESGADIVVQRLLWAIGYFVSDDEVIELRRDELVVGPEGVERFTLLKRRALTDAAIDAALARTPRTPDHMHFRAVASKQLAGDPVGGYAALGVRPDDPNDRVPHEHRRDLRAFSVFSAWFGSTDVKEYNTLDMWIEDPARRGRGYLMHYLIDFGKALGAWVTQGEHEHDSFAGHFDYGFALRSLFSFGLWSRPWEAIPYPSLRGVGRFDADRFLPDTYAPAVPYAPFLYTDRFDGLWAAEILARVRPEHVEAAVARARYSDPRSRAYLTRTLIARQRKLMRYWFTQTTPLARFRLEPDGAQVRVCAEDLMLGTALARAEGTRYALSAYDRNGAALAFREELAARDDGALCSSGLTLGAAQEGYTRLAIRVQRGTQALSEVVVHLARSRSTGEPQIIGIERR
jgi:hypothetical protein